MKILLQCNLMGEQWLQNCKTAIADLPHDFIGVIPFSREITSNEPIEGKEYIPYGSTLLSTLAADLGWVGCHLNLEKFNYEAFAQNRNDMLNAEQIVTIAEAIEILDKCPADQQWFVRPSLDLKQFSGQCINAEECHEWFIDATECDSSGTYRLEYDTKVVLARPKDIQAEWRYFVVDGRIVSGSMYRLRGQLVKLAEHDVDVLKEAQLFADQWLPDKCCVMDLALVDGELKVVEFNCINSSGFYNHDVKAIFTELYKFHGGVV